MKKLILVLSVIFIGCETNQNRQNANWDFDSSTGDYIQWESDNDFANEMTNAGMEYLYNFEYDKSMMGVFLLLGLVLYANGMDIFRAFS